MGRLRCDLSALFLAIGLAACATGGGGERSLSEPATESAESEGVPAVARIPLVTTREEGVADSQVVPVLFEEEDAWLALDTGAPFTFLYRGAGEEELVEHAGTVRIGGKWWELPGYGDDAIGVEMFQGKPIVGILGLDFFSEVPSAIDYPGGEIVRYLGGELPERDAALPRIPLAGASHDRPLVEVVIDGTELTMIFDTGAHDTFWLGVEGSEEDEVSWAQTADGKRWEVFVGRGEIALPGEPPRSIPVVRALEIGYLAEEMSELGHHGLLGLTALGWRRIVLDFENGVLILGPRAD